jgi:type I restriction enzyme S subunit
MDAFRQQIKTGATTTINQITGRMLDDVTILLPPLALVDQFTAFVEQTDKSKFEIQKSLEKLETLKKALMQKYFG